MSYAATRPVEVGTTWTAAPAASPQKIRWGAVFAGTVLGLGLLALLSTLWFALAYGSEMDEIRANLEWYVGISAIVCLFIGGLLAGWLSGVRGAGAGFFNGMAIWAMVLILTLAIGVPAIMSVLNVGGLEEVANDAVTSTTTSVVAGAGELWATFWAMLGSLAACAIGGAIGGAVTKPANADLAVASTDTVTRERVVEDDVDDDDVEIVERPTVRQTRVS